MVADPQAARTHEHGIDGSRFIATVLKVAHRKDAAR
jgi:hypothetical protein